ncbi:DNA-binding protein, partial [Acinetobacter baumannii]|nr:DNA-binding protein [Acinetobacter baumannii]
MTEETSNKRRYPSASAWAEAEALWASGDVTLEDLAKKVGVSATSVSLHMKKRKITKGEKAKEHSERISKQVAEDILSEGTVHSQRIKETKEEHYK